MASPLLHPQSVCVPKHVLKNPYLPVWVPAAHGACKGKGKGKGNGDDDEVRRDLHGSILVDMPAPAPVPTKWKWYNKDKDTDKGKDDKVGGHHQAYDVAAGRPMKSMNINATPFVRGNATHHNHPDRDMSKFTTRSDIINSMKAIKSKRQLKRQPKCIMCGAGIVAWKPVLCPQCFVDDINVPAPPPIPHSLSLEESLPPPPRKVIDEKLACVHYWVDKYTSTSLVKGYVKDELLSSNQIESFLRLNHYVVLQTKERIQEYVQSRERILMANKPPGIRKIYPGPAGLRCEPPPVLVPPPCSWDFSPKDIYIFLQYLHWQDLHQTSSLSPL
jgi:hypothetical protein